MKHFLKKNQFYFIVQLASLLLFTNAKAQIEQPVKWTFTSNIISKQEVEIVCKADFQKPWHIYSSDIDKGGPVATAIIITKAQGVATIGKFIASRNPIERYDSSFMMKIRYFDSAVEFKQRVSITSPKITIAGYVEFMVCNDSKCLPSQQSNFSLDIDASNAKTVNEIPKSENQQTQSSIGLWLIFLGGFLGGLLALLTPCVFPMIPMTVSFFIKRGDKKHGIRDAIIYGVSIIVIYVLLGLSVTLLFGSDAMNALSTNPWFNVFFFLLLIVFGASFLGAFEIQLPTSWSNFFDKKSDSSSGLLSIFFMAFTLGLVSFSCTGPIIGTLLVQAAVSGSLLGPVIGMFGFSLALALPFTLFALFPSWLKKMPKSGGWLNSVKVVLGFLELALSLKFLSTADLVSHWGILPRETFLVLWIVIFALLGLYLLGKLRFAHDSELTHISVWRLFLAIVSFSFSLYMVPGLWGAPLKAINAFSPPLSTQDFNVNASSNTTIKSEMDVKRKYSDVLHSPLGLQTYFDYDEGMAYAKKVGKPVLLDFTGHGCVNCRKMEASVWSEKTVLEKLSNDYVIISLYVDDRTELPQSEQSTAKLGDQQITIRTIGNKWSYFQASTFGVNSQPYYVLLDNNGKQISKPTGFNDNVDDYLSFLNDGLNQYKQMNLAVFNQEKNDSLNFKKN